MCYNNFFKHQLIIEIFSKNFPATLLQTTTSSTGNNGPQILVMMPNNNTNNDNNQNTFVKKSMIVFQHENKNIELIQILINNQVNHLQPQKM